MVQVRRGVFETNSSSVHTLTFCMNSEYNEWIHGERVWYDGKLFTPDELEKKKLTSRWFDEDNVKTYEDYWNGDLEGYEEEFTTPGGETVVAFGKFGYDS